MTLTAEVTLSKIPTYKYLPNDKHDFNGMYREYFTHNAYENTCYYIQPSYNILKDRIESDI